MCKKGGRGEYLTWLSGCLTALYPFFTPEDLLRADWLLGTWQGQATRYPTKGHGSAEPPGDHWHFRPGGDSTKDESPSYRLTHYSYPATDTVVFEAWAFRLDGQLYLDLRPYDLKLENSLLAMAVIPGHALLKVEQQGNALRLSSFSSSWLAEQIEAGKCDIAFEQPDAGSVVLTAATEELQRLLRTYADEAQAFEEMDVLRRK